MADQINKDGKFYVCSVAQDTALDAAGFAALSYDEAINIITMPTIGLTEESTTIQYIGGDSIHHKTYIQGTQEELVLGYDDTDAVHASLIALSKTGNNYAVYRELPNGTIIYGRGRIRQNGGVMAGGGEDPVSLNLIIDINQALDPITA